MTTGGLFGTAGWPLGGWWTTEEQTIEAEYSERWRDGEGKDGFEWEIDCAVAKKAAACDARRPQSDEDR